MGRWDLLDCLNFVEGLFSTNATLGIVVDSWEGGFLRTLDMLDYLDFGEVLLLNNVILGIAGRGELVDHLLFLIFW